MGTAVLTVVLQSHLETAGTSQAAMAGAFGDTFVWVMGITAVALLPTLVLARIERRARRRPAGPARRPSRTDLDTRELALESV